MSNNTISQSCHIHRQFQLNLSWKNAIVLVADIRYCIICSTWPHSEFLKKFVSFSVTLFKILNNNFYYTQTLSIFLPLFKRSEIFVNELMDKQKLKIEYFIVWKFHELTGRFYSNASFGVLTVIELKKFWMRSWGLVWTVCTFISSRQLIIRNCLLSATCWSFFGNIFQKCSSWLILLFWNYGELSIIIVLC